MFLFVTIMVCIILLLIFILILVRALRRSNVKELIKSFEGEDFVRIDYSYLVEKYRVSNTIKLKSDSENVTEADLRLVKEDIMLDVLFNFVNCMRSFIKDTKAVNEFKADICNCKSTLLDIVVSNRIIIDMYYDNVNKDKLQETAIGICEILNSIEHNLQDKNKLVDLCKDIVTKMKASLK